MSEKGGDAQTLGLVVLHEQQMLAARLCIGLQSRQCLAEAFRGRRLAHEGEGAAGQPMLTILVELMIWTGICRVCGFCLSWLSTVQPSMSGRKMSSEIAAGL